ncbi:MAG: AtpZ/AtpI family protein [Bacteroidales bacterium]|nr:AtpZ/AtpI family protein [Bacteroidales bacterium]
MDKNKPRNKNKTSLHNYAKYSGMALQMMAIIVAGAWGGVELDKVLSWKFPVMTVILSMIAVVAAIYISIREFLKK